ncbi:ABC transporter substrate-binding protein [Waterburya agarophytonicola K14]|uniref:non-specific serine/threonine protein kinase n=1 Tax=Waterburya agarophytonicola KI4 TaxID=2874699 RepID=A0A964BV98_9CYAN|nr:bifunctional serine/threonine-protein kinase/ABC transporter substrate-binding protein [Waterburya agarophytonicola]MCC0178445.1 ABC transporter substrate-binding protein [Waterburya agarophytonicola KI4]
MSFGIGDLVNNRYRIIRSLDSGGFGTTYLVRDTSESNQPTSEVALKQIKLSQLDNDQSTSDVEYIEYIEKLERESDALERLGAESSDIPKYLDSFYEENYYYIVQEYIEGSSLKEEIISGVKFSEENAICILREILNILIFVHQNNVIHRDIKPANIIRRKSDGKLVLIDFGAVKEIATEQMNNSGIKRTRIICSDGYTPVEQRSGNPQPNSDIYALGIMIMKSVTGFSIAAIHDSNHFPLRDRRFNYLWEEHASHTSSGFKKIISRMIQYHFDDRYQSVEEVLEAIEELESQKPEETTDDRDNKDLQEPENINEEQQQPEIVSPSVEEVVEPIQVDVLQIGENPGNYNISQEDVNSVQGGSESIIDSEPPINPKRNPVINFYNQHRRQIKFIALSTFALLGVTTTAFILGSNQKVCSLKLGDSYSCGEEVLNPSSVAIGRDRAAEFFLEKNYKQALESFQEVWGDHGDPESLIYLNNALLDAYKIETETIAISVPYSFKTSSMVNGSTLKGSDISKDFLRGIAQAQTQVNLRLSNSNSEIEQELIKFNFLPDLQMGLNKGLRVVIADDANKKGQAIEVANPIADNKNIVGIIGLYASGRTLDTIRIYNKGNLPQISYGSTVRSLSKRIGDNFFRVVPTTEQEAAVIENYINNYDLEEKKIAIFYNPRSDYSTDLRDALIDKIGERGNATVVKKFSHFDLADEENFSTKAALNAIDNDQENEINIFLVLPDGLTSNALAKAIEIIEVDKGKRLILGGNPLVNSEVESINTDISVNLIAATPWHHTDKNSNSDFSKQAFELWNENVNGNTAMAYDATRAMIEAINRQEKPTRQGTIDKLNNPRFSVPGASGDIGFNTSNTGKKNGDRKNLSPKLVRLSKCEGRSRHFVSISLNDTQVKNLVCQTEF